MKSFWWQAVTASFHPSTEGGSDSGIIDAVDAEVVDHGDKTLSDRRLVPSEGLLPRLPRAAPMKARLGQKARDFVRLLLRKPRRGAR